MFPFMMDELKRFYNMSEGPYDMCRGVIQLDVGMSYYGHKRPYGRVGFVTLW